MKRILRCSAAFGAALLLLTLALVTAAPTAAAAPARRAARPATIQIPAIGVDAPMEVRTTVRNQMQDPTGPEVVSWYNDSARPGTPGNAVVAGHLEVAGYGPAVFDRLHELRRGDMIVMTDVTGTAYRYRVVGARPFRATSDRWDDLTGPTERQTLTLITCAPPWDEATGNYVNRLVVRAVRVTR